MATLNGNISDSLNTLTVTTVNAGTITAGTATLTNATIAAATTTRENVTYLIANSITTAGLTNSGNNTISGNESVEGILTVTGATTLNGNTSISGSNTLTVGTGATYLGGTLTVEGTTVHDSQLTCYHNCYFGQTNCNGFLTCLGYSSSGDSTIQGTSQLIVAGGATTLGGTLTVAGVTTFNGSTTIGGGNSLTFTSSDNSTDVTIVNEQKALTINGNIILTGIFQQGDLQRAYGATFAGLDGTAYTANTDPGDENRTSNSTNTQTDTSTQRCAIHALQIYPGPTTSRIVCDLKAVRLSDNKTGKTLRF